MLLQPTYKWLPLHIQHGDPFIAFRLSLPENLDESSNAVASSWACMNSNWSTGINCGSNPACLRAWRKDRLAFTYPFYISASLPPALPTTAYGSSGPFSKRKIATGILGRAIAFSPAPLIIRLIIFFSRDLVTIVTRTLKAAGWDVWPWFGGFRRSGTQSGGEMLLCIRREESCLPSASLAWTISRQLDLELCTKCYCAFCHS